MSILQHTYKDFESKLSPKSESSRKLLPTHVPLGLGLGSLVKVTDLSDIRATEAAIQYYAEQIREKIAFDAREKENDEFWKAVHDFISYWDKYTLPEEYENCLVSVWEDQSNENLFLEKYCTHGTDCKKINNCSCYNKPEPKKRREAKGKKEKEVARY
jgi:hypothetical protein